MNCGASEAFVSGASLGQSVKRPRRCLTGRWRQHSRRVTPPTGAALTLPPAGAPSPPGSLCQDSGSPPACQRRKQMPPRFFPLPPPLLAPPPLPPRSTRRSSGDFFAAPPQTSPQTVWISLPAVPDSPAWILLPASLHRRLPSPSPLPPLPSPADDSSSGRLRVSTAPPPRRRRATARLLAPSASQCAEETRVCSSVVWRSAALRQQTARSAPGRLLTAGEDRGHIAPGHPAHPPENPDPGAGG